MDKNTELRKTHERKRKDLVRKHRADNPCDQCEDNSQKHKIRKKMETGGEKG